MKQSVSAFLVILAISLSLMACGNQEKSMEHMQPVVIRNSTDEPVKVTEPPIAVPADAGIDAAAFVSEAAGSDNDKTADAAECDHIAAAQDTQTQVFEPADMANSENMPDGEYELSGTYVVSRCVNTPNINGHSAVETETIDPSCMQCGKIKTFCKACDKVLTTVEDSGKPALGHDWYEKSNTATCTAAGKKTFGCTRCSETKSEKVNATGHVNTYVDIKAATCIENGWEKTMCDDCGAQVGSTKTLPAHGNHNWETASVVTAANEYSDYWGYGDYDEYLSHAEINCDRCKYCYDIDENSLRYKYSAEEVTSMMLGYVNQLRQENGLPALQASSKLISNAQRRAQEISINFVHTQSGENINKSSTLNNCVGNAFSAFYNSPGHRDAMLLDYQYFGCAIYYFDGRVYCAQVFD